MGVRRGSAGVAAQVVLAGQGPWHPGGNPDPAGRRPGVARHRASRTDTSWALCLECPITHENGFPTTYASVAWASAVRRLVGYPAHAQISSAVSALAMQSCRAWLSLLI